jgi:hypothetical protein
MLELTRTQREHADSPDKTVILAAWARGEEIEGLLRSMYLLRGSAKSTLLCGRRLIERDGWGDRRGRNPRLGASSRPTSSSSRLPGVREYRSLTADVALTSERTSFSRLAGAQH